MRCPYHEDEPSIACAACEMNDDQREMMDGLVVDVERERVLQRLKDVEAAVEDLRDAMELFDEALARREDG